MQRSVHALAILAVAAELSGSASLNALPAAEPRDGSGPPSGAAVAQGVQERISRALALVDVPFTTPEMLQTKNTWESKDGFYGFPSLAQPLFEGAVIFTPVEACKGADGRDGEQVKPNELVFTAREKGVVLVAVPRSYDGDRTGGWFETRTSEDALRKSGWKGIAAATLTSGNRDYGYAIFARSVERGERFRFHSRKVRRPLLIVPSREQAEKVLAARTGISLFVNVEYIVRSSGELGRSTAFDDGLLLGVHDWYTRGGCASGSLLREIVRQSLLMTFRDEFGVQARDRCLRETLPEGAAAKAAAVEIFAAAEEPGSVRIALFRRPEGKFKELWNELIPLDRTRFLPELVAACEGLSRSEFVDALEGGEYKRQARSWREGADGLDEERERRLRSLNLVDQFALVRNVHREIRGEGESAERLSALSRGYAHLGSLTEYYCSPAHKVFKARALLYAERLVACSGHSRFALQNRAYVRALVGLHSDALADLSASRADGADGAEAEPVADPPPWCEVIEAYCRFDRPDLERLARDKRRRALCNYLRLLAAENVEYATVVLDAAQRVLRDNPACLRAVDAMARGSSLGIKRVAAGAAFAAYPAYVYPLLRKLDGLPPGVEAVLDKIADDPTAEIDLRPELLAALRAAGAPERDRGEPSLDILAQLLQELSFMQCLRLIEFEHDALGVPVAETLSTVRPLIEGHPCQPLLESFALTPAELRARHAELNKSLHNAELELSCARLARQLEAASGDKRDRTDPEYRHADAIYGDLSRLAVPGAAIGLRMHYGAELAHVSPHSPQSVAYGIEHRWDEVSASARDLEEKYSWSEGVQRVLANRYLQASQFEDAERCLVRRLKASPSLGAHVHFANFYKGRGRIEEWRAVLEQFLEQPSYGLEHARVRVMIAEEHMARQEWEKALPYAVAAAESWSGWSMQCAARCYEGLEDWENAELYIRRTAQRYESSSMDWFYWCKRTGRGDVQAAQEHAYQHLESLGAPLPPEYLIHVGAFYDLTGEHAKALEVFRAAYEQTSYPRTGLRAALLADRLNKPEVRDEILAKITDPSRRETPPQASSFIELAREFARVLGAGGSKVRDVSGIAQVRKNASAKDALSVDYFAGAFLARYGDMATAREHLRDAAQSAERSVDPVLAADALRRMTAEQ